MYILFGCYLTYILLYGLFFIYRRGDHDFVCVNDDPLNVLSSPSISHVEGAEYIPGSSEIVLLLFGRRF